MIEIYKKTVVIDTSKNILPVAEIRDRVLSDADYVSAENVVSYDDEDIETALHEFNKLRNSVVATQSKTMRGYYDLSITIYYIVISKYISVEGYSDFLGFDDYTYYVAEFEKNVYLFKGEKK